MAFLFKRNPKSPGDLVRALNEQVARLDHTAESKKHQDECLRHLKHLKLVLHGDDENDPQPDQISLLAQEIYASDTLYNLVLNLRNLDFDLRKDVAVVFLTLLRRRIGCESPTVDYIVHSKPEIVTLLLRGPEHEDAALVCGQILRDCVKYEPINKMVLYHPLFWPLFRYAQLLHFEIATDVFVTLHLLLTVHKPLVAQFLAHNCDNITSHLNALMKSDNYVTKRQSVRLLTEIVLQKLNQQFLMYYFDNALSLKIVMLLLSDKLKNVQLEGFHIFKFFVAKPKKSQKVLDILIKNKENFVKFFENFDISTTNPNLVEERDYIMMEIAKLPSIERIP